MANKMSLQFTKAIIHISLKEILASEVVPSDTDISVLLTVHLPSLSLSHTWLDPLLADTRLPSVATYKQFELSKNI